MLPGINNTFFKFWTKPVSINPPFQQLLLKCITESQRWPYRNDSNFYNSQHTNKPTGKKHAIFRITPTLEKQIFHPNQFVLAQFEMVSSKQRRLKLELHIAFPQRPPPRKKCKFINKRFKILPLPLLLLHGELIWFRPRKKRRTPALYTQFAAQQWRQQFINIYSWGEERQGREREMETDINLLEWWWFRRPIWYSIFFFSFPFLLQTLSWMKLWGGLEGFLLLIQPARGNGID